MKNERVRIVKDYVMEKMANSIIPAHDFEHVDRVRKWALKIAKSEQYLNFDVVETAALLHDIGMLDNCGDHGERGAEITAQYLIATNLFLPEEIFEICNAIRFHNKKFCGEGKLLDIIRDADMLDMFGAGGIVRACTSKANQRVYDPVNPKGETWGMTSVDFDRRFEDKEGKRVGVGKYIIDQINFQISCLANLKSTLAKELALPMIEFMISFILELETEINSNN